MVSRAPITATTRIVGVTGWPVAHSRSPLLHNLWLARHGIDALYAAFPIEPGNVSQTIRGLAAAGLVGLNVTVPHKLEALTVCDKVSEFAHRIRSVNTLRFDSGAILGDNTDGFGFIANLRAHGANPSGPALVLGAGGASRAIVAALQDQGAAVTITNRTRARADALAAEFPGTTVVAWSDAPVELSRFALLVNTTSAGMHGHPPLDFSLAAAAEDLAVADAVYVPRETMLLRQAAAQNLRIIPGLGMLLHQAARSFAFWFGVEPDVDQEVQDLIARDIPLR